MSANYPDCDWCGECKCCPAHNCETCKKKIKEEEEMDKIDYSELGCPPGCTSPFCDCPGTD